VQYAATAYTQMLQQAGVQISMADIGAAWQNGHAERLIRTIKEEEPVKSNDNLTERSLFLQMIILPGQSAPFQVLMVRPAEGWKMAVVVRGATQQSW